MSKVAITINAEPDTVYGVLADPVSYALWVVGNKRIRGYDRSWPAPGSEFYHEVGFGLITVKDKTVALESNPGRRLVMLVRALPFVQAKVSYCLEPEDLGTRITMDEVPIGGPWERLWNPVFDTLTGLRNAESLRRLRLLAEVRAGTVHR